MRIAIDARHVRKTVDGLGRYVLEMIKALEPKEGDEVFVIHTHEFPINEIKDTSKFKFVQVNIYGCSIWQHFIMPLVVLWNRFNVYYYPFIDPPLFVIGAKRVFAIHDLNHFYLTSEAATENRTKIIAAKIFIKLASRLYHRIIVFSKFVEREVGKIVPGSRSKITAIYHGSENFSYNSELSTLKNMPSKYILYVGNNRPHKNLARLIEGFKLFCNKENDTKLVIAGNQMTRFLNVEKLAKEKGIGNRVLALGKISNQDLIKLYNDCKFVIYPSLSEGFGFPIIEAWHFKKPIIVSNASCLPEIGGDAALYIDPYKAESIAVGIEKLLKDNSLQEDLVVRGSERIRDFRWSKSSQNHLETFRELLHE